MWEIIFTYLLQKGGIFGLLFAMSTAWIIYREKQFLDKGQTSSLSEKDLEKVHDAVSDVKDIQEKISDAISDLKSAVGSLSNSNLPDKIEKVKDGVYNLDKKTLDLDKKIEDLWAWHSVKDSDGVPIWYVRKSLEDSIKKLEESVSNLKSDFFDANEISRHDLEERLQKSNDSRVSELRKVLDTYNKTVTDLVLALEKIKMILDSEDEVKNVNQ